MVKLKWMQVVKRIPLILPFLVLGIFCIFAQPNKNKPSKVMDTAGTFTIVECYGTPFSLVAFNNEPGSSEILSLHDYYLVRVKEKSKLMFVAVLPSQKESSGLEKMTGDTQAGKSSEPIVVRGYPLSVFVMGADSIKDTEEYKDTYTKAMWETYGLSGEELEETVDPTYVSFETQEKYEQVINWRKAKEDEERNQRPYLFGGIILLGVVVKLLITPLSELFFEKEYADMRLVGVYGKKAYEELKNAVEVNKDFYLSSQFLFTNVREKNSQAIFLKNVVWIYPANEDPCYQNLDKGRFVNNDLVLCFTDGKKKTIPLKNDEELQNLLQYLSGNCHWIISGYSEELMDTYKSNMNAFKNLYYNPYFSE